MKKALIAFACLASATPAFALDPNATPIPALNNIPVLSHCLKVTETWEDLKTVTIYCDSRLDGPSALISTINFRKSEGKWILN